MHAPSAFPQHRVVISSESLTQKGFRPYTFEPYELTKFKKLGNLVSVPRFKAQGKVESDFDFPFVNHLGQMSPYRIASIRCRLDYFVHCLAHTIYSRLYRHMARHYKRDGDCLDMRNSLLQVSYVLVIDTSNTDYQLQRLIAMIRHRSKILKRYVFDMIRKLPNNEKGFLRACLRALTPRSQWIAPLGGKGRKRDFSGGPYVYIGSPPDLRSFSAKLRLEYGRCFAVSKLNGQPERRKIRYFPSP